MGNEAEISTAYDRLIAQIGSIENPIVSRSQAELEKELIGRMVRIWLKEVVGMAEALRKKERDGINDKILRAETLRAEKTIIKLLRIMKRCGVSIVIGDVPCSKAMVEAAIAIKNSGGSLTNQLKAALFLVGR